MAQREPVERPDLQFPHPAATRAPAPGASGGLAVDSLAGLPRRVRVRVTNVTRGWGLADAAMVAQSFGGRLRGLMGRRPLGPGEGLVLVPCRQVHGFGLRGPVDVVFCDADGRVSAVLAPLEPGRIGPAAPGARCAVELPEGTIAATGTLPGDVLLFEALPGF